MLNGKRVAILIGPKFHDEEVTIPRDFLKEQEADVDVIGLDDAELTGKYNRITLTPDTTIDAVKAADYDGLVIPGGGAPERIRVNETALQFVKDFWATGRPVGAICHGPQVLISAKLLEGVTLTCFIGIRDDVQNVGATFVDEQVCVDGQLISSRTPDDLPAFNNAFAKALAGDIVSDDEKELSPLEALQVAASREKGAQDFYAEMAAVAQDEAVQNKFKYLSAIEEGHFLQLSDLHKQLSGEEPTVDIKQNELGKHRVSPGITSQEAVELAIFAEEKAYEFYRHAASKSKSEKIKEMFEYLAAEELEHKRLFLADKAAAQGGQGHFQWATHFDIPPGMDDLW